MDKIYFPVTHSPSHLSQPHPLTSEQTKGGGKQFQHIPKDGLIGISPNNSPSLPP